SFNGSIPAGGAQEFEFDGPGCLRHWWTTYSESDDGPDFARKLRLRIDFDGDRSVDQPLGTFFGTFLDRRPLRYDAAPMAVREDNGFNCYLPMPYSDTARVTLRNETDTDASVWFMGDVHRYEVSPGPLRFRSSYTCLDPATDGTFAELARFPGSGFVAGLFHGTDARSGTDAWYHTGGDTWLLDGPTDPHVIRGIGGEDVFGYSFGVGESTGQWQGVPFAAGDGNKDDAAIGYRFFGPDPVVFDDGALMKFGTQPARIESTVYGYTDGSPVTPLETIEEWELFGPFDARTFGAFDAAEYPEESPDDRTFTPTVPAWGSARKPVEYLGRRVSVESTWGWVDPLDEFAGSGGANFAAGGNGGAVYARGQFSVEGDRAILRLGFDDWLKLWIDGEHVTTVRHDDGFAVERVEVPTSDQETDLLLKVSNHPNREFLAWAFNLAIEPT
ncbi:MAG: DUF2961 domain-containing protein, partial [Halobacteriales archaeon]